MPTNDLKFKVNLLENEEPIDSPIAHAWTAFLNGFWTRDKPNKPGKYMINKNGRVLGEVFVYTYKDNLVMSIRDGALCKLRELKGTFWWWSVRMPQHMPREVPRWVDEADTEVDPPRLFLVKE